MMVAPSNRPGGATVGFSTTGAVERASCVRPVAMFLEHGRLIDVTSCIPAAGRIECRGATIVTAWGRIAELLGEDLDDIELLGRGSSGAVYRATERSLGRTVAVKVFRRFTGDETDRVFAEAKAQASLSWHANVVSLYRRGVTQDGFPYIVMEYAPGGSLEDRVRDAGPLDEATWRRAGAELAAALAVAHDAGVVHCDVKPSNVLFAADGSVRLADFGIARATGMTSGTLDSIEGSIGYVPPELLDGQRPVPANDVYSMALTLAFAQSGHPPFPEGLTLAQAVAAVQAGPPELELAQHCSDPVAAELLERSYARDPAARPDAGRIAAALQSGGDASKVTTAPRHTPGRSRRLWTAVAAVVLIGVAGLLLQRPSREPAFDIEPASDIEPVFDLCSEYETYARDREDLIADVTPELAVSHSAVGVVDRMLNTYPEKFAELSKPFIDDVIDHGFVDGDVTAQQLATVVTAENLRVLDDGERFLNDGENREVDAVDLPPYLQEPARVFSEVNEYAASECPKVSTDFTRLKAALKWTIRQKLTNPGFLDSFFDDPDSYEVIDAHSALLIATYAWGFFEDMLSTRTDWLFETFERQDDVRRVISTAYPEALLKAVQLNPGLIESVRQPEWAADLQLGLDRASPAARAWIAMEYRSQIEAIGATVPEPE